MLETYSVHKDIGIVDTFLVELKNELLKVDRSLYRAVTEFYLARLQ